MTFQAISIEQAKLLIENDSAVVIDIRDRASFEAGHIENAIHIDNDNVANFLEDADQKKPLLVCCYHGNMSKGAADYFNSRGFENTYSINGGYSQWSLQD